MFNKMKRLAGKTIDAVSSAATMIGDLNGDGKVDEQDAKIAVEWAKRAATEIGDEAGKLGKSALRSEMAKDAATGAVIGAAIAVPVPIVGPMAGAAVGAGVGIYKNLTGKGSRNASEIAQSTVVDRHTELLKLDDLLKKRILTQEEFNAKKRRTLKE